jgi:hypothetical protein
LNESSTEAGRDNESGRDNEFGHDDSARELDELAEISFTIFLILIKVVMDSILRSSAHTMLNVITQHIEISIIDDLTLFFFDK